MEKKEEAKNLFDLGVKEYKLDNFELSTEYFKKALSLLPDNIGLLENLSLSLYNQNKFLDAIKILKKTIDLESHETKHVQQFCNDISEYMREIQRAYSFWYNKTCSYDRSGHLWKSRFQSQPIESSAYLWACLKYVEMNPVRAGICPFPEDFLGSTFGRWHASGNHIFEKSFTKHIISLCHDNANVTIDDFKEYMTKEMARYSYSDKMKESIPQIIDANINDFKTCSFAHHAN